MTRLVTLQPGGRKFNVLGEDTILDSALSAGIDMNYGCSNGNCGQCAAKIISGRVTRVKYHDFVVKSAKFQSRYTLTCSYTAADDLVLEVPENTKPDEIPTQNIVAKIKKIERAGGDSLILRLQTPRTHRLRFLAGQQVELSFPGEQPQLMSIASCPCDDRNLEFHLYRSSTQPFTQRVFDQAKPRQSINVTGPSGQFILSEYSPRPHIFIAFDTGFGGIKSLIEQALNIEISSKLHLYWFSPSGKKHYLHNLVRSWSDSFDNFHYHPQFLSATEFDSTFKLESINHLSKHDFYIAGLRNEVNSAIDYCTKRLVPRAQIKSQVI